MNTRCYICNRKLEVDGDPLSMDCGGDCWGCVGAMEADGFEPSLIQVRSEFLQGLRNDWIPSPEVNCEIYSEFRIKIRVRLKEPLGEPWKDEIFTLKLVIKSDLENEVLIERLDLRTNSNGECIYILESSLLENKDNLWVFIVRKSNEWGYPISVASNI